MIKKLKLSAFEGAIRTGGFFGWFLTVLFLCERNIVDQSVFLSVNNTFLISAVITCAVLLITMLFVDFEGILADKWLRWLPGLLMAESGIALSLSGAKTLTLYAAIAGVACAVGGIAMISSLLKVKVAQRIFSVGAGLAVGGVIRVISGVLLDSMSERAGKIVAAVLIGLVAAVTVHTTGFSKEPKPLLSHAEAKPVDILRKIPSVYVWVLILGCAFMTAFGAVEGDAQKKITSDLVFAFNNFETIAYLSFAVTALLAVFVVKPHSLASLFSFGAALATASAVLLGLSTFSNGEAVICTILCFAAYACFRMCMYLIVVTFSLDRPHPLFYALFGFGVITLSELLASVLRVRLEALDNSYRVFVWILVILIPVSGFFISRAMRYSGYSQEQLEKRHRIRKLIARVCEEKELSERERSMLDLAVLDGYSIDMMPDKLGISRNTVKAQVRALTAKFDYTTLEEVTEHFHKMIDDEEAERERQLKASEEEHSVLAALAAESPDQPEAADTADDSDKPEDTAEVTDSTDEDKTEAEPEASDVSDEAEAEEKPEVKVDSADEASDRQEETEADKPAAAETASDDSSEAGDEAEAEESASEDSTAADESAAAEQTESATSAQADRPKEPDKAAVRVIRRKKKTDDSSAKSEDNS